MTATGHFSDGSTFDVTSAVVWKSSAKKTASVTTTGGLVKGVKAGTASITAKKGNITSNTATVTVN